MAWHDDPNHPFAGIAEKLKRADENIVNLKSEIDIFIQSSKYPVVPYADDEAFQEAISYHRNRYIPRRLSVLAGEVVHHLRSCLDHVVWHFSIPSITPKIENVIEFPIFGIDPYNPADKDKIRSYERKVQGITNANVLALIKEMQPYNVGADVADHAFLIIHNMDRFDKHRELVIVASSVEVNFPPTLKEVLIKAQLYSKGKLDLSEHLSLGTALKDYAATPGIAFQNFGSWTVYPVVKGLADLLMAVNNAIAAFAPEV